MKLPILAITMGDPAGIGPEIVVRALNHKETYNQCRPIVTGDAEVIRLAIKALGLSIKVNAIKKLVRVSTPGLRKYASHKDLPRVLNGLGIAIISTSKGVMTDKEARELNVGGEVLCYVY